MTYRLFWPAPVWLPLGGALRPVMPLRLRDLGTIEAHAAAMLGHPHERLAAALALATPAERHEALRGVYLDAKAGKPLLFDPSLAGLLRLPELIELQLRLAIHGTKRKTTRRWLAKATPDEVAVALEVAWAADPVETVAHAIDREMGVPDWYEPKPRNPRSLAKCLSSVVEWSGWTLEEIGDLYLTQWDHLLRGDDYQRPVAEEERKPAGWTRERFKAEVLDRRAEFWRPYREAWRKKREATARRLTSGGEGGDTSAGHPQPGHSGHSL